MILRLDHFVLTVKDVDATCEFYVRVLNMKISVFEDGRKALFFGEHKINLHPEEKKLDPHALRPLPGAMDFCLITETPLEDVLLHLKKENVVSETKIVMRTGSQAPLRSIYIRDPDGNLIELSNEVTLSA